MPLPPVRKAKWGKYRTEQKLYAVWAVEKVATAIAIGNSEGGGREQHLPTVRDCETAEARELLEQECNIWVI